MSEQMAEVTVQTELVPNSEASSKVSSQFEGALFLNAAERVAHLMTLYPSRVSQKLRKRLDGMQKQMLAAAKEMQFVKPPKKEEPVNERAD